jgi:hypothetical protein
MPSKLKPIRELGGYKIDTNRILFMTKLSIYINSIRDKFSRPYFHSSLTSHFVVFYQDELRVKSKRITYSGSTLTGLDVNVAIFFENSSFHGLFKHFRIWK